MAGSVNSMSFGEEGLAQMGLLTLGTIKLQRPYPNMVQYSRSAQDSGGGSTLYKQFI